VPFDHPQRPAEDCGLLEAGAALGEVAMDGARQDLAHERADLQLLAHEVVEEFPGFEVLEPEVGGGLDDFAARRRRVEELVEIFARVDLKQEDRTSTIRNQRAEGG
jgi:hypothetical protein